ncbi:type II toxin-antitoxin system RelE/ParE family toxin [Chitinophaga niabensis]|uniref:Proteic killer suppression protein n=1 Tax=Chitinophaga niabensis TaxID=536979 RepID=A0A1N6GG65_9BACT|nr:type II toxin-antitoxin system RelE/ParE family toxin [Chitinophaga niabensis]SIO06486.1 proteic killer suppression protein [Chitinophaga niabensis]
MIKNFKSKALRALWENDDASSLPAQQLRKILTMLDQLNTAKIIPDNLLGFKGWRIHQLRGPIKNVWSLTVTGNYRIVFLFEDGNAYNVDYLDYH